MKDLIQCRAEIDAIDRQIAALFEQRMQVSRNIAAYKHAHQLDILDAAREQAVLKNRADMMKDEALRPAARELFMVLMGLSREEQQRFLRAHDTPQHK